MEELTQDTNSKVYIKVSIDDNINMFNNKINIKRDYIAGRVQKGTFAPIT